MKSLTVVFIFTALASAQRDDGNAQYNNGLQWFRGMSENSDFGGTTTTNSDRSGEQQMEYNGGHTFGLGLNQGGVSDEQQNFGGFPGRFNGQQQSQYGIGSNDGYQYWGTSGSQFGGGSSNLQRPSVNGMSGLGGQSQQSGSGWTQFGNMGQQEGRLQMGRPPRNYLGVGRNPFGMRVGSTGSSDGMMEGWRGGYSQAMRGRQDSESGASFGGRYGGMGSLSGQGYSGGMRMWGPPSFGGFGIDRWGGPPAFGSASYGTMADETLSNSNVGQGVSQSGFDGRRPPGDFSRPEEASRNPSLETQTPQADLDGSQESTEGTSSSGSEPSTLQQGQRSS